MKWLLIAVCGDCSRFALEQSSARRMDIDGPESGENVGQRWFIHSDWGHLPCRVLDRMKGAMDSITHGQATTVQRLRLVNRHWCKWVSEMVTSVTVFGDPSQSGMPSSWDLVVDAIANKFTRVCSLSCPEITDEGMSQVGRLTNLQQFNVLSCLRHVQCDHLQHLGMRMGGLEPKGVLARPIVRQVVHDGRITDSGLMHLGRLACLTRLDISGCSEVTDNGLMDVAHLSSLTHLDLSDCQKITDSGLRHVSRLTRLTYLDLLKLIRITSEGLEHVCELHALQDLGLACCSSVTSDGLKHVGKLTGLQRLGLYYGSDITGGGLEPITKLACLSHLDLGCCCLVSDQGLQQMGNLECLLRLDLAGCSLITDKGLEHLCQLTNLQHLNIMGCHSVTDKGAERIGKMPSLTHLCLAGCSITGSGLAHIEKLTKLAHLELPKGLDFAGQVETVAYVEGPAL
ncbi:unnamed protein product [Ostreobium quekettii]|uniref:Disease resistance R13L4/SHOC-2-like LRR domain-containing protein n=1 Tax=Ostreobium quekettii TaxID=121088 RepID=A0A8S1IPJ3_9CHLO|nr:unnamed protein product [Ostreobium quekettii]|eukprot:evm.model.scf_1339.3 EVM.evm.TU.scf_1339.3   scf_1339:33722-36384(-)